MLHPAFTKIAHFLGNQPISKTELPASHRDHGLLRAFDAARSGRSRSWLTSQIASIAAFRFLIIVQPTANLSSALATHTDLPSSSSGIGHRQDEHLVPLTTRALRTVLAVSDGALQQRPANSPLIGNLPTSFSRAPRVCLRIIQE